LEGIEGATNKDIAGEMIKAIENNFKRKLVVSNSIE
jgi:ribosomal protein S6--L-glutamate ligase